MGYDLLEGSESAIVPASEGVEVWTFAGGRANRRLAALMEQGGLGQVGSSSLCVKAKGSSSVADVRRAYRAAKGARGMPMVDPEHPMVRHLKFAELLPPALLQRAAACRLYA